MASNGLVANKNKTVFMLLNMKKQANKEFKEHQISIAVGDSKVERSGSTNLLGVTIEESQGWSEHINKFFWCQVNVRRCREIRSNSKNNVCRCDHFLVIF